MGIAGFGVAAAIAEGVELFDVTEPKPRDRKSVV